MFREDGLPAAVQPLLERMERWRFRDGEWQSVPWPDHSNCKCSLPSGELESGLTDLKAMPMKVVYGRRMEKLFRGRFRLLWNEL